MILIVMAWMGELVDLGAAPLAFAMPFSVPWSALFQILILWVLFYYLFLFFRGTRGAFVLMGLILILMILFGLTYIANLDAINWIVRQLSAYLALAFLIIFQPEIRRALAELGKHPSTSLSTDRRNVVDAVVETVQFLADHRVGALIAMEREMNIWNTLETGTKLDAKVDPELLSSIFFPHTPLHDGGVIIRENRIVAAGCVFPLSQNAELAHELGTRHRAAIGLSEETDAIVVVVSEETGTISVCYRGRLSRGLDQERLRRFLAALLIKPQVQENMWKRARKHLDLTPEGIAKSDSMAEQGE